MVLLKFRKKAMETSSAAVIIILIALVSILAFIFIYKYGGELLTAAKNLLPNFSSG